MNAPAWAAVLGYNELRNAVVFLASPPTGFLSRSVGDAWRDEDDVACCHWLARHWRVFVNENKVRGVVSLVAHRSSFHPVRDELLSHNWDGVSRVDRWLETYFGVEPSAYVRTVGRWWLISAVARVMQPGCKVDTMLILEGAQGARKSSALRALAGGDYFLDDLRDVGGVESAKQLCGKWIVELSELDAFRKAENSTIKRFVSQQSDNYRASYGRTAADYPRQCVFAGTTNHEEYLQDETGARRFWPVLCGTISVDAIRRDRAQLWAEAVALYSSNEKWWPETPDEVDMCAREQTERQVEEPWAGKIAAFVAKETEVTTRRVLYECLGIELGHMKDAERRRVAAVLRRLGWRRSKKRLKDGARSAVARDVLTSPRASRHFHHESDRGLKVFLTPTCAANAFASMPLPLHSRMRERHSSALARSATGPRVRPTRDALRGQHPTRQGGVGRTDTEVSDLIQRVRTNAPSESKRHSSRDDGAHAPEIDGARDFQKGTKVSAVERLLRPKSDPERMWSRPGMPESPISTGIVT